MIAIAVVGGVVGAGAVGAGIYYGFFAGKSALSEPLMDPVAATKSPMV